jgi:predicted branched-subunit amino acid permease
LADAEPAGAAHDGGAPVPLRKSPAARIGLSISIATGLYGISFGALGVASGLDVLQTMALSLLMFTGGSQFAFIGVLAGGGSGAAATAAATLLGVRNAVYGMQLNAMFAPRGWRRFVAPQFTIDESTATAVGQDAPTEQRRGFWIAGLGVFVLWNAFTAVGALAGNALGDPKQWGLDGAAVAAFLGLLWPRLKGREPWAIGVVCALATVAAVPFVPSGVPILVAALVAAVLGWVSHARARAGRPSAGAGVEGLEPDLDPNPGPAHGGTDPSGERRRRASGAEGHGTAGPGEGDGA